MNLPRIVISVLGFLAVLTFSVLAFSHAVSMIGAVRQCPRPAAASQASPAQPSLAQEGPRDEGQGEGPARDEDLGQGGSQPRGQGAPAQGEGQGQADQPCRSPVVGDFTRWTMSSLGAAVTTLVGGFLGLSGLTYKNEVNERREGALRRTLSSTGGGSALLGVFLWVSSGLYVAVLLFALGTMVWLDTRMASDGVALAQSPNLLRELAATGVGLLLAAIAVLGQTSSDGQPST
jgi:hypothetical protein